jgi:hypothetical protein
MEPLLTLTIRASDARKIELDYIGPLLVRWRILNPRRVVDLTALGANLEAQINTPIGFIPMASKAIPAGTSDYSPLAIIQYDPAWEWVFKSPKGFEIAQLCFVEYTNSLTMPTNNPPPAIQVNLSGVETRLDNVSAGLSVLSSQLAQPETATNSNSQSVKVNPWSGDINNHKILGADAGRKFAKMHPDPGMLGSDRILIAVGEAGKGALPGPEGWQYDYELLLNGWYSSEDEDSGLAVYAWSIPGNTDPIFCTVTEGY